MGVYTRLIRPLLFSLPPETAQKLEETALGITPLWKSAGHFLRLRDERLRCGMGGISIKNPVGLAAGHDKNARHVGGLANLGFGYIVIGTVVSEPREGNRRPRLMRDPAAGSITNSLGFPSLGLERVARNLGHTPPHGVPLVASISGLSIEEFKRCYEALQPLVAGVELNISSPNTEGIRAFQEPQRFEELLDALGPQKESPLFVKLPPYFEEEQRGRVLELVDLCVRHSVDGVTAVNTRPREDGRLAVGRGGLSGAPLFPHMIRIVRDIRSRAGPRLAINACGGISTGANAVEALSAGANTVQIFTGLVYQGPGVVRGINRHLLRTMEREGIPAIRELRARTTEPNCEGVVDGAERP